MELHQLRYFVAVARLGNFTRAAEACHVAQPSLSQQIAKLEHDLGQALFDRQGRTTTLTPAGQALLEQVERALQILDDARDTLREAGRATRLTIAAIPTIAPYLLPEVLIQFAKQNPTAQLDVREYTTDECLKLLTEGTIDVALLALPIRGESFHTEPLFVEELQLVVPAKHPLAKSKAVQIADLHNLPFVVLHEAHCLTGSALGFCARHGLNPIITAQLHQLSTVLELVRLGQGVSLMPTMAVAQDRHPDRVYRQLAGEDRPTRTVGLATSKLRFRRPIQVEFIDFVKQWAAAKSS